MRQGVIALLVSALLLLGVLGVFSASQSSASVEVAALAPVSCTDVVVGQQVRIRCTAAGIVVLNTAVNIPETEVTVPGATVTVEVPQPGQTQTIRIPGPTQTVTAPGGGTETVTVAVPGEETTVRTPRATNKPSEKTTATSTPGTTRQTPTDTGTLIPEPEDDDSVVNIPGVNLKPIQAVELGTLVIVAIALLILLGMYIGYYMGYKDSNKAEASFYRSLLGK